MNVAGYVPGPGISLDDLLGTFNLGQKLEELLFNIEGNSYAPGPGFLSFLDLKGPVIYIYSLPLPNPKPFWVFFLKSSPKT